MAAEMGAAFYRMHPPRAMLLDRIRRIGGSVGAQRYVAAVEVSDAGSGFHYQLTTLGHAACNPKHRLIGALYLHQLILVRVQPLPRTPYAFESRRFECT